MNRGEIALVQSYPQPLKLDDQSGQFGCGQTPHRLSHSHTHSNTNSHHTYRRQSSYRNSYSNDGVQTHSGNNHFATYRAKDRYGFGLCAQFVTKGSCAYGDNCRFSHATTNLSPTKSSKSHTDSNHIRQDMMKPVERRPARNIIQETDFPSLSAKSHIQSPVKNRTKKSTMSPNGRLMFKDAVLNSSGPSPEEEAQESKSQSSSPTKSHYKKSGSNHFRKSMTDFGDQCMHSSHNAYEYTDEQRIRSKTKSVSSDSSSSSYSDKESHSNGRKKVQEVVPATRAAGSHHYREESAKDSIPTYKSHGYERKSYSHYHHQSAHVQHNQKYNDHSLRQRQHPQLFLQQRYDHLHHQQLYPQKQRHYQHQSGLQGQLLPVYNQRLIAGTAEDKSLYMNYNRRSDRDIHRVEVQPWIFNSPVSASSTVTSWDKISSTLSIQAEAYIEKLDKELHTIEDRQQLALNNLTKAVQEIWSDAIVDVYGSNHTRLSLPTSDVDCVIAAHSLQNENPLSILRRLAADIAKQPWATRVELLDSAKIPVLKIVASNPESNDDGEVLLDLTCSHSVGHSGLAARDLVYSFQAEMPALRPLVLILKQHLLRSGLNCAYTGGLSSYALVLLVIRYLQACGDNHIKTFDSTTADSQLMVDNSDVNWNSHSSFRNENMRLSHHSTHDVVKPQWLYTFTRDGKVMWKTGLGNLLFLFLETYITLDYRRFGISIENGGEFFTLPPEKMLLDATSVVTPYISDPIKSGRSIGNCFRLHDVWQAWFTLYQQLSSGMTLDQAINGNAT